jgi:hypothetical protein
MTFDGDENSIAPSDTLGRRFDLFGEVVRSGPWDARVALRRGLIAFPLIDALSGSGDDSG